MMIVGAVPYRRGCLVIVSQILGGIAAAAVVSALLPGPIAIRTSLALGVSVAQGLFIEMFLTAQLVFTIFMLAAEKHRATFIAPVGIGLSLFIAELFGVYYTGGSVNPARSFGPCVVVHSFYSYHWIYWVGPILGSMLASGFYMFIKAPEYETVNHEQDDEGNVGMHFNPATQQEKPDPAFCPAEYANMQTQKDLSVNPNGQVSAANTPGRQEWQHCT
jgi:aquaporin rerated protein, other eukaryote